MRDIIEKTGRTARPAGGGRHGGSKRKIGDLYTSFMDEDAVEAAGARPAGAAAGGGLRHGQHGRRRRPDRAAWTAPATTGCSAATSATTPAIPDRCLLHLYQGGLGLPDESYYREEKFAAIRTAYVAHVETMFAPGRAARRRGRRPSG